MNLLDQRVISYEATKRVLFQILDIFIMGGDMKNTAFPFRMAY